MVTVCRWLKTIDSGVDGIRHIVFEYMTLEVYTSIKCLKRGMLLDGQAKRAISSQ